MYKLFILRDHDDMKFQTKDMRYDKEKKKAKANTDSRDYATIRKLVTSMETPIQKAK